MSADISKINSPNARLSRKMVKRSIFRKLLVTMVGLIISLLTLLTFVQIEFQRNMFERELEKRIALTKGMLINRGHILSDNLVGRVRDGVAAANLSFVGDQIRELAMENDELYYIILMQASGQVYINTRNPRKEMTIVSGPEDKFAAKQKKPAVYDYTGDDGTPLMEFIIPIQVSTEPWGALRLGFSLAQLNKDIISSRADSIVQIRKMISELFVITAIFIVVGGCVVLLVSERLSRPLMHLTRLADELAQGNFSVGDEIKTNRQNGEIGALTKAFIQMSGKLKVSYDKLEDYSRTLEQKVIDRTAELAKARDQAIAADKSKSEFLSVMSHEIRTPMNAIIGLTRLALQTELTAKQQDYLTKVQVSSRALLGIINDILDFSKIEAGKLELESILFNLDDVLNDLASLVVDKAEEKGLRIHFVAADEVPVELIGDPLRLGQVLLNLVGNAIKFTNEGEIVIAVGLASATGQLKRPDQTMLEFSVKDTGIGLTTEQMGGLFQSFNQADKSTTRKYGGTGLGLAICKRMVNLMNGDIHVNSEIGKGSTFTFTAVFGQLHAVSHKRAVSRDAFRDVKALVVDAEQTSREALCLYLEGFFFQVAQAATGEQAMQLLENSLPDNPYQLVLIDWDLPDMGGMGMARQIRNDLKVTRDPRIIMIGAQPRKDVEWRSTDLELDGFLTKPVHPSVLFNTVIEAFDKYQFDEYSVPPVAATETKNEKLHKIKGAKVLLVEDNHINQQVAKETLEQEGFNVTIVGDGEKALQQIRQNDFDVVLMDLQMPIMDGYEATRILRSETQFDKLPIIAMTAHALNDVRESCMQIGMNGYVTKPIDVDELMASLINFIKPELRQIPESGATRQTAESIPEYLPGIDGRQGLKNVAGNAQLFCDLLVKFEQSYKDAPSRLAVLLEAGDVDSALKLLHAMKGVVANLAMPQLRSCIEALEQAVRTQSTYGAERIELEAELNRVCKSVGQLCGL